MLLSGPLSLNVLPQNLLEQASDRVKAIYAGVGCGRDRGYWVILPVPAVLLTLTQLF